MRAGDNDEFAPSQADCFGDLCVHMRFQNLLVVSCVCVAASFPPAATSSGREIGIWICEGETVALVQSVWLTILQSLSVFRLFEWRLGLIAA